MQNGLGITLKGSVILKVKIVKGQKIHSSMLKSFVEINFEISGVYKAQCAEENSPLNFTEQFCKMLIA